MIRLALSICLFIAQSAFASASSCDTYFSELQELVQWTRDEISIDETRQKMGAHRNLPYTRVETPNAVPLHELDIFKEPADLIVAIDVTGNTQGHTYLIINGTRFDGRMFFAQHTVQKTDWKINRGLVIRYRHVPEQNLRALVEWLESEQVMRTPTCVAAACKILYDIASFGGAPKRNYWFPSTFLKNIAKNRLIGVDGKPLEPEIYTINADIRMFWNNLPNWIRVPTFLFKVLFDPYTWAGSKKKKADGQI